MTHDEGVAYIQTFRENYAVDYDEQIAFSTAALQIDPADAEAYDSRGMAIAKGDLDRGITDLNEAIRLNPKKGIAFWIRGLARAEQTGDLDAAISDYNEAIHLSPPLATAYQSRGDEVLNPLDADQNLIMSSRGASVFANRIHKS